MRTSVLPITDAGSPAATEAPYVGTRHSYADSWTSRGVGHHLSAPLLGRDSAVG